MNLTTDQQHILKVMSSGANVFLSGASGTEKSHLISKFIGENSDKNIIICSPASSADENYAGDTLRGIFGVPGGVLKIGNYNAKPCDALKRADIIIIEKINMCRIDVFEYAVRTLRNLVKRMSLTSDAEHYKKQIILAGDFYKAPPILRKEDKKAFVSEWGFKRETDLFAFNSSLWEELALESVILEDSMHSDNASKSAISNALTENTNENEVDAEPSRFFTVVSTFYNDISGSRPLNSGHFRKVSVNDYDNWNEEEDNLLQDEWARGLGIDEISRLHDRTIGAVRARLIRI